MSILYEGPSLLDAKPIVVIMTGGHGATPSKNEKTGGMAQVYILRADTFPTEAVKSGADSSICGGCPHRPSIGGSCYVNVGQAPNAVYKTYRNSGYNQCDPVVAGEGLSVRLGAYGDLVAPDSLWHAIVSRAKNHTAYTHLAASRPGLKGIAMASADSEEEALRYQSEGWKTFRVKKQEDPLLEGEIYCPNETHGVQCIDCKLCNGNKVNVAINAHGTKGKINKFNEWYRKNDPI
jgi:hypothetical protein